MDILEGHNKFYVNDANGNQVAEIVFVPTGEHLSIIEHTDVDESLKGLGVGKQLVAKVVEKMRGENRKIIPLCPFAKHEFDNGRCFFILPAQTAISLRSAPLSLPMPCLSDAPPVAGSPVPLSNHTPPADRPGYR